MPVSPCKFMSLLIHTIHTQKTGDSVKYPSNKYKSFFFCFCFSKFQITHYFFFELPSPYSSCKLTAAFGDLGESQDMFCFHLSSESESEYFIHLQGDHLIVAENTNSFLSSLFLTKSLQRLFFY